MAEFENDDRGYLEPDEAPRGRDPRRVIDRAKEAVRVPAIILIVVAGTTVFFGAMGLLQITLGNMQGQLENQFATQRKQIEDNPAIPPEQKQVQLDVHDTMVKTMTKFIPVVYGGMALGGLISLVGGISMLRLKSRGLAYVGAIISMVPGMSFCCLMGIPVGIWAILVLGRPEVAEGFKAMAHSSTYDRPE